MDNSAFIQAIAARTDRSDAEVSASLKSLSHILATHLSDGDSISMIGFGTFEPKMRPERITNHPSSGRKILVPPKLSVAFRPAYQLKNIIKNLK